MTSAGQQEASHPESRQHVRLAYLLSAYPAISHTFFLNEIAELRKHGFSIEVASINKPRWPTNPIPEPVSKALATTYYIKNGKPLQVCLILLAILLTQPHVVWRGLWSLRQLDGRDAKAKLYSLFYLAEALILGDWLRRRGYTHLHVHFGGPVATVGMLASIAWQIPYSITIHGPEEFYDVDNSFLRKKVEKAAFVLCISEHCRSQLMKLADPAHWNKLHVVRLGVDVSLFTPAMVPQKSGCFELICVGRLVPDKGQLVLLRAFARLLLYGHKLRLRLIGDGIDRCRLEAFILQNNLGDSVILEGALSHEATRRLLGEADIFVLASFAEGLPVALMEAMAMEIPCVSTYIAGIPELIRSEVDGLLVPASSEQALVDALDRLIRNPELRSVLARSGRLRVLDFYDLHTNVGVLADTLRHQLRQCDGDRMPQSSLARRKEHSMTG